MKRYIQLLVIGLICLVATPLFAAQVAITCPSANQISINTQTGTAISHATRSDGEHRIYMQGDTVSHKVRSFTGGEFVANMLACSYLGDNNDFSIMNYSMSGDLWNCRFNNKTFNCGSNNRPESCQLICDK